MTADGPAHTFSSRHPPARVLTAYADEVPAFAGGLPMIASVDLVASDATGEVLGRVHRWSADVSLFPGVLTRMLPTHYFQWTTDCRWNAVTLQGTWTLNIGVFGEGAHIAGEHRFRPDGDGTSVEVRAEVLVDPRRHDRLAGIPVPGPIQRVLDRLIRRVLAEVVARSGEVVERHLDAGSL